MEEPVKVQLVGQKEPVNAGGTPATPAAATATPAGVRVAQPVKKEKLPGKSRDKVFGIIIAVLSVLLMNSYLFGGIGLGVSLCMIGLFVMTVIYCGKPKKMSLYAVLCGALTIILSAGLVFSDSGMNGFIPFITAILTFDIFFIETRDFRRYPGGTLSSIIDWGYYDFGMTFGNMGVGTYAMFHSSKNKEKGGHKAGSVVLGILIALPVLVIVIPLLMSSDAAFEAMMKKLPDINLAEIIVSLFFGLSTALLLFSRQFALKTKVREKHTAKRTWGIDPTLICSALGVISIVYILYIISQFAYFFNAFSGLLDEGYTVAQYARRGFFEMSFVCFLNLVLVFLGMFLCRRKEEKHPVGVKLVSAFFCVFSLLLDATAMSKMVLYIKSFGMTRLRIITSLFMLFLAVVFIAVLVRIFAVKTPYLKIAVIGAAVICCVGCFGGIDRLIANYNVDAYLDGRLSSVDTGTIEYLDSYSTVPALIRLAEYNDSQLSKEAKEILNRKYYSAFAEYGDWIDEDDENTFNTDKFDIREFKYFENIGLELLKEKKDLFFNPNY